MGTTRRNADRRVSNASTAAASIYVELGLGIIDLVGDMAVCWPKANLVHSIAARKPLVAIILSRASVKLFELGLRTPGGLFLDVWYTPSPPIFGVILGLLEATKMYKREREKVYFPQYNKIYVGLNDNNKTKWRVAGKAQGPS